MCLHLGPLMINQYAKEVKRLHTFFILTLCVTAKWSESRKPKGTLVMLDVFHSTGQWCFYSVHRKQSCSFHGDDPPGWAEWGCCCSCHHWAWLLGVIQINVSVQQWPETCQSSWSLMKIYDTWSERATISPKASASHLLEGKRNSGFLLFTSCEAPEAVSSEPHWSC